MGSYNFLGLAASYDESMRTVKDVLEEYGLGVASTRHEMGMYVHHFEILSSWASDSLWQFLKPRSHLDGVPQKAVINCKMRKVPEGLLGNFKHYVLVRQFINYRFKFSRKNENGSFIRPHYLK